MRRRNDPTTAAEAPARPLAFPAAEVDARAKELEAERATAKSGQATLPNVGMEDRSSMNVAAPGKFKPPRMPQSYERIVTTVFDLPDPHEAFTLLRQELELSVVRPSNATYGDIVDALDQAEKNAQRAVELVANFNLAHEAFEMDELAMSGSYREQAKARLEADKRTEFEANKATMGSKASSGKQITEDDVRGAVASMFPDEARVLATRRAEAKGALLAVKSLADRWAERAKDLRVMVQTTRAASSSSH